MVLVPWMPQMVLVVEHPLANRIAQLSSQGLTVTSAVTAQNQRQMVPLGQRQVHHSRVVPWEAWSPLVVACWSHQHILDLGLTCYWIPKSYCEVVVLVDQAPDPPEVEWHRRQMQLHLLGRAPNEDAVLLHSMAKSEREAFQTQKLNSS